MPMNSEVIQEVAKQLGIAADQIGQYLGDLAPQWAAMKIATYVPSCVVGVLLLLMALAFAAFCRRLFRESKTSNGYERRTDAEAVVIFGLVVLAFALFGVIVTAYSASITLPYAVAPDATFVRDLLGMVGK